MANPSNAAAHFGVALLLAACNPPVLSDGAGCDAWIPACETATTGRWGVGGDGEWWRSDGADGIPFAEILGAVFDGPTLIAVGDHRNATIHYFDLSGTPVRTVGGLGAGPGELESLDAFGSIPGGMVWGYDLSRRRLLIVDSAGHPTTIALQLASVGAWPMVSGFVSDSIAVVVERHLPVPRGQQPGALVRDSTRLLSWNPYTSEIAAIGVVPRADIVIGAAGAQAGIGFVPFGPSLQIAADPVHGAAVWGFSDSLGIFRWGPGNEPRQIVAAPTVRGKIEPRAMQQALHGLPKALVEVLKASGPNEFPAFGSILIDRSGDLWISEYQPSFGTPSQWAVFDREGKLARAVSLPARFRPTGVWHPNVVGVYEDASGEESLRLYRLVQTK